MNNPSKHLFLISLWVCLCAALAAQEGGILAQPSADDCGFGFPSRDPGPCATQPIQTASGPICGKAVPSVSSGPVWAYLGIPYAQPPVGNLRWRAPLPHQPWRDTFAAVDFGPICPQNLAYGDPSSMSEDCLTLNIWAPQDAKPNSKLPVLVFINGGAFLQGSSSLPVYDGREFAAQHNILVVSFNYRIGPLGFLAVDDQSEGNYGILDQQLALRWIQQNIAKFGGDPQAVTLYGQSAGAMSVLLHMLSAPGSSGLFKQAILSSNPAAVPYKDQTLAKKIGKMFLGAMHCRNLDELRKKSWQKIQSAETNPLVVLPALYHGLESVLAWAPNIDGTVLTQDPVEALQENGFNRPVIIGSNFGEGQFFESLILDKLDKSQIDLVTYEAILKIVFGTKLMLQVNNKAGYKPKAGDNGPQLAAMLNDYMFWCSNLYIARQDRSSVYGYFFARVAKNFNVRCNAQCSQLACHGAELPFVFHSARSMGHTFAPEDAEISNEMMRYWANFVKSGDPNKPDTPKVMWPNHQEGSYLAFGEAISVSERAPNNCDYWDKVGYNLQRKPFWSRLFE